MMLFTVADDLLDISFAELADSLAKVGIELCPCCEGTGEKDYGYDYRSDGYLVVACNMCGGQGLYDEEESKNIERTKMVYRLDRNTILTTSPTKVEFYGVPVLMVAGRTKGMSANDEFSPSMTAGEKVKSYFEGEDRLPRLVRLFLETEK